MGRVTDYFESLSVSDSPAVTPQLPVSKPLHTNSNKSERRKIIGWFKRRTTCRSNPAVSPIREHLTSLGIDQSAWVCVQFRECHGRASGRKRLEIICSSKSTADESFRQLKEKAEESLNMEFTRGKTHGQRVSA